MHCRIFSWCTFSGGLFEKQLSHQISGFCQEKRSRGVHLCSVSCSFFFQITFETKFLPSVSSHFLPEGVLLSYCLTALQFIAIDYNARLFIALQVTAIPCNLLQILCKAKVMIHFYISLYSTMHFYDLVLF